MFDRFRLALPSPLFPALIGQYATNFMGVRRRRRDSTPMCRTFGGRDLEKGGGWLEVSTVSAWPRSPTCASDACPKRRRARCDWCTGTCAKPGRGTAAMVAERREFGRFHLLVWNGDELQFAGNYPSSDRKRSSPSASPGDAASMMTGPKGVVRKRLARLAGQR